jgi:hypothetical protein
MNRDELEKAALAAAELAERHYQRNLWDWAVNCVYTIDEASQEIRPFPAFDYLEDLCEALTSEERLIVIPKSRRMFVSWMVSIWMTWLARYWNHHAILFQSETESKAAFLVDKRCVFIENHLEGCMKKPMTMLKTQEGLVGKVTYKPTESWILGVAQGPDVLRAYTPSEVVIDESEFQPQAGRAVEAALPLVEKRTKLVLVSTSNGPGKPMADICKSVGFYRFTA